MKIENSDFCLGVGAILLSGGYLYFAGQIQESLLSDEVGAAGIPTILGWAMGVLGLLLCVRSIKRAQVQPDFPAMSDSATTTESAGTPEQESEEVPDAAKSKRSHALALGLLAILVTYVASAPWLGYAASIACLVAAVARYCGAPLNRNLLLIPVAAGLFFWVIFVHVLSIPMPASLLLEGR